MRIFIALKLPQEFIKGISEHIKPLQEKYSDFRWVREENVHITLCFLGELDNSGIEILNKAVRDTVQKTAPIALSAGKLLTLPHGKPANVLALGIDKGKEAITALADDLEKSLARQRDYSFRQQEKRVFVPHITLARRGQEYIKILPEERSIHVQIQGIIEELVVFKSDLQRNGAVYTPVSVYPFNSNRV